MRIQKAIFSQFFYLQTSIRHLKRPQKSCFINKCFKYVLFAWEMTTKQQHIWMFDSSHNLDREDEINSSIIY